MLGMGCDKGGDTVSVCCAFKYVISINPQSSFRILLYVLNCCMCGFFIFIHVYFTGCPLLCVYVTEEGRQLITGSADGQVWQIHRDTNEHTLTHVDTHCHHKTVFFLTHRLFVSVKVWHHTVLDDYKCRLVMKLDLPNMEQTQRRIQESQAQQISGFGCMPLSTTSVIFAVLFHKNIMEHYILWNFIQWMFVSSLHYTGKHYVYSYWIRFFLSSKFYWGWCDGRDGKASFGNLHI